MHPLWSNFFRQRKEQKSLSEMLREIPIFSDLRKGELRKFDSKSLSTVMIALFSGLMNLYWISGKKMDYGKIWRVFSKALLEGIRKEA